jgi:hypothetical protein
MNNPCMSFQELKTIEWYDGPVQQIVRDSQGHNYYRGLLSIRENLSECIFCILRIERSRSDQIIALTEECTDSTDISGREEKWKFLKVVIKDIITDYDGVVLLERTSGLLRGPNLQKAAAAKSIKFPAIGIDEALDRNDYEKWEALVVE